MAFDLQNILHSTSKHFLFYFFELAINLVNQISFFVEQTDVAGETITL